MILASYALISNAVLLIGVTLAERFMYWPSVPVFVLLATGVVQFWRRQLAAGKVGRQSGRLLRWLGVLLLLALAVRSLARNLDWSSNGSLFAADVQAHPQGAHLNKGYAGELMRLWKERGSSNRDNRLLQMAAQYLDRAIQVYPGYVDALTLRGQVRAQLGDLDGALLDVEAAIQLQPASREARRALAQIVYGGEAESHLAGLRAQVASQPGDAAARLRLGKLLLECGQTAEAREQLEQAVALVPDDIEALHELASALALAQQTDRAVALFERVLSRSPDDWQAHANLATLLASSDPKQALEHAQRAYQAKSAEPRNGINLAEAYVLNGQKSAALALYEQVQQQLDPNDPLRRVVAQRLEFLRGH
jgi:tetratricopeptide (TPR) repeat protein